MARKLKEGYKGPVKENEEAGGELIATEIKSSGPSTGENGKLSNKSHPSVKLSSF